MKVGDRVRWVDTEYKEKIGRTATVTLVDLREQMVYVNWDGWGRPFVGTGPWFMSRFESVASTPFEQSVQEYIAKELYR